MRTSCIRRVCGAKHSKRLKRRARDTGTSHLDAIDAIKGRDVGVT